MGETPLPWSNAAKELKAKKEAEKKQRGLRGRVREANKHKTTQNTAFGCWHATLYVSSLHGHVEATMSVDERGNEGGQDAGNDMLFVGPKKPLSADVIVGANIELRFIPDRYNKPTGSIRLIQFKRPIKPDRVPDDAPSFRDEPGEENTTTVDRWNPRREGATPFRLPHPNHRPYKIARVGFGPNIPRGTPSKLIGKALASNGSVVGLGGEVAVAHTIDTPREPTRLCEGEEEKAVFTVYAYDDDNKLWLGGVSWGYTFTIRGGEIIPRLLRLSTRASGGRLHPDEDWARTRWNRECANTAEQVPPDNDPAKSEDDEGSDSQLVHLVED